VLKSGMKIDSNVQDDLSVQSLTPRSSSNLQIVAFETWLSKQVFQFRLATPACTVAPFSSSNLTIEV
jgi:hypothetical protein